MPLDAFIEACRPWLTGDRAPWPESGFDQAAFVALAPVVQERVSVLAEVPDMVDFLFLDEPAIDEESWDKSVVRDELAGTILTLAIDAYRPLAGAWKRDELHAATLALGESVGRKLGKAQAPIRVAVTGRRVGPPLFEAMEVLGPERTLARLQSAHERATAQSGR
jgi:glutamyl-tRNA synthetase